MANIKLQTKSNFLEKNCLWQFSRKKCFSVARFGLRSGPSPSGSSQVSRAERHCQEVDRGGDQAVREGPAAVWEELFSDTQRPPAPQRHCKQFKSFFIYY